MKYVITVPNKHKRRLATLERQLKSPEAFHAWAHDNGDVDLGILPIDAFEDLFNKGCIAPSPSRIALKFIDIGDE
ncbi:hypothetical protein HPC37_02885 [Pasteurellaceae bacterium 20609_3]|uniref:hypothetical protein n=1 Tax=Spirabiliibacterium mucosae TaxID=28156 RepID=UPI001AAD0276|nr:hypothetical protein [Spirabiliibacterium mucosae]MBE2897800.1 hypothetical protein [Spirabiliibacterium mucosae]